MKERAKIVTLDMALLMSLVFVLLWAVSRYNYLLSHVTAEGFSICPQEG
ncbi:MAG: hypothetical protein Q7I97_08330 [Thermovirgaceae bacterium]|nr:hypothetical protein [Thermovirgaceae bacterium]